MSCSIAPSFHYIIRSKRLQGQKISSHTAIGKTYTQSEVVLGWSTTKRARSVWLVDIKTYTARDLFIKSEAAEVPGGMTLSVEPSLDVIESIFITHLHYPSPSTGRFGKVDVEFSRWALLDSNIVDAAGNPASQHVVQRISLLTVNH